MVEVDHGNGVTTRYAHLSVLPGHAVEPGAVLGRVGSARRAARPGAHLHYEIPINGELVDPQRFLRAVARIVAGLE